MSFSGITVGATAKRAGTVSPSAEGVSASVGAICSLTLPLESFLVFSAKFSLLENIFDEVLGM